MFTSLAAGLYGKLLKNKIDYLAAFKTISFRPDPLCILAHSLLFPSLAARVVLPLPKGSRDGQQSIKGWATMFALWVRSLAYSSHSLALRQGRGIKGKAGGVGVR